MPTRTKATLVAIFSNMASADNAISELKANGFTANDIYMSSEESGYTGRVEEGEVEVHRRSGLRGWLASIFGKGGQQDESRYEEFMRSGNILVGVDATETNIDRAVDILNNHSPVEVHSPGDTEYASKATAAGLPADTLRGETRSIPVVEEELKVGKRAVLRGGVRVYSRTVEEPVEESVNLEEEHIRVERQPADRPASESDFRTDNEQTVEVKEYAEEPVVSKEARVVEDIHIGKDKTERTETIRDKVRHTETDVENIGDELNPIPGSPKKPAR